MKFTVCTCFLFYLIVTGSAFPRAGRPHPLWGSGRQSDSYYDFLTMALLMGFDLNELLALQAASGRGLNNFGLGGLAALNNLSQLLAPRGPLAQQRARQDMNTLSLLGIIDGADVPDAPVGRAGRRRGGRNGGNAKAGAAAGGEVEGAAAPPAKPKGKKRRGPRRQGPNRG